MAERSLRGTRTVSRRAGGRKEIPTEDGRVSKLIRGIERRFGAPVKKSAALGKRDFLRFLNTVTDKGKFDVVKLRRLRLGAQVPFLLNFL